MKEGVDCFNKTGTEASLRSLPLRPERSEGSEPGSDLWVKYHRQREEEMHKGLERIVPETLFYSCICSFIQTSFSSICCEVLLGSMPSKKFQSRRRSDR